MLLVFNTVLSMYEINDIYIIMKQFINYYRIINQDTCVF